MTVTLQDVTHASETFEVVPWHQPYPLSVSHPQTHASNARHRVKQNAQNFKIPVFNSNKKIELGDIQLPRSVLFNKGRHHTAQLLTCLDDTTPLTTATNTLYASSP